MKQKLPSVPAPGIDNPLLLFGNRHPTNLFPHQRNGFLNARVASAFRHPISYSKNVGETGRNSRTNKEKSSYNRKFYLSKSVVMHVRNDGIESNFRITTFLQGFATPTVCIPACQRWNRVPCSVFRRRPDPSCPDYRVDLFLRLVFGWTGRMSKSVRPRSTMNSSGSSDMWRCDWIRWTQRRLYSSVIESIALQALQDCCSV